MMNIIDRISKLFGKEWTYRISYNVCANLIDCSQYVGSGSITMYRTSPICCEKSFGICINGENGVREHVFNELNKKGFMVKSVEDVSIVVLMIYEFK